MIVIDGLDECDAESVESILGLILVGIDPSDASERRPSKTATACQLKWFISSRRDDPIPEHMGSLPQIDLEKSAHHVRRAVEEYVLLQTSTLAQKKRYDRALENMVRETLLDKAEGTFLWVSLACSQLGKPGVKAMHTARLLSVLPSGLTPLYQQILDDILLRREDVPVDDQEYVTSILRAMAYALRPLTLLELGAAADLPDEYREDRVMLEDFVRLCGAFVELRQDKVHFVHASVKVFLSTVDSIFSQTPADDHLWMAKNCFFSLTKMFDDDGTRRLPAVINANGIRPATDFLDYPAVFWNRHLQQVTGNCLHQLHKAHYLWDTESLFRDCWFEYQWKATHIPWHRRPEGMTGLLIAAYMCLPSLVKVILDQSDSIMIDETDSAGNTALIWAAKSCDSQSIAFLIECGANINRLNNQLESPLHFAADNGALNITELLIAAGAQVNGQDHSGWTALHRAAFGNHRAVLERLLSEGAEFDLKDQYSWTALQRSASNGTVGVLCVLIDHQANIDIRDREGMTPLSTAAWNGHGSTIMELLNRGAKIEGRDYEGWTALHHACWNGRIEAAQKLVERGAKTDSLNKEQCTPLFQATWNGHIDIVRLLLRNGADVNKVCTDGEAPLQQAAWAGHSQIVELLLKSGARINQVNDEGLTALHQASVNGQEDVVELLLEAGADPYLQNSDGQTAYDQAEENSYATTALVLQEKGSPHPSVSSSYSDDEFAVLDSAVAKVLSTQAASCIVQRHGHACSSKSWKVTVGTGSDREAYFLKTGPNVKMFEGIASRSRSVHVANFSRRRVCFSQNLERGCASSLSRRYCVRAIEGL